MLYQTAKDEIQSPPHGLSFLTLFYEAATIVLVALGLSLFI